MGASTPLPPETNTTQEMGVCKTATPQSSLRGQHTLTPTRSNGEVTPLSLVFAERSDDDSAAADSACIREV